MIMQRRGLLISTLIDREHPRDWGTLPNRQSAAVLWAVEIAASQNPDISGYRHDARKIDIRPVLDGKVA